VEELGSVADRPGMVGLVGLMVGLVGSIPADVVLCAILFYFLLWLVYFVNREFMEMFNSFSPTLFPVFFNHKMWRQKHICT